MARSIFVNLPVQDLGKTVDFFTQLGFEFDPRFTDDNATCMIVNDGAYVMLLVEPFFKSFTSKDLAPTATSIEVINAVSLESRQQVDELCDKALSIGASPAGDPQDHGFMYQRSFTDPNGHWWEFFYMDESAIPAQQ